MLILDANILVRAVLGKRVRGIIEAYFGRIRFLVADAAVGEARRHVPRILEERGLDPQLGSTVLEELIKWLEVVESDVYAGCEADAKRRLAVRDVEDWPTAAAALTFGCDVWTEDSDFFGAGIATWTTDRVEILLESLASRSG